eukprot:TRINITY_DN4455_c0_g4_i1.p1 TRINITY_DN4455_c0_g4~~TRINITY_DN4455_c0_g4_i1.p1  ORF type:complete len:1054 (-),score=255.22 TRINITY_DN4455_c0_g4_i1:17-3178(-)
MMNEIELLLIETDLNISRSRHLIMEIDKNAKPKPSSFEVQHWETENFFENNLILRHILSFLRNLKDLQSACEVSQSWHGLLQQEETWKYFSEHLFLSVTEKHVHEHHGSWKSFYLNYLTSDLVSFPVFYERKYLFIEKRVVSKEEISIFVNFMSGDTFRYIFPLSHTVDQIIVDVAHDLGILNQEEYGLKRPDPLHTWLSRKKTLTAQDIGSESYLHLRRQLYIPDHQNTILFLDYPEAVEKFVTGQYPCNRSTAFALAAFIIFVKYGPHKPDMKKKDLVKLEECLPKTYHTEEKKSISEIFEHYQSFKITKKLEAKKVFLSRIRALPSYGKTVFPVEVNKIKQNLCISFSHPVLYLDNGTSTTVIANSFLELKEWKASMVYLDIDVKSSKTKFLKNPQAYPQAQPPSSPQSPSQSSVTAKSPQKTPEKEQLITPSTPLQQIAKQQTAHSPVSRFAKIQKTKGFKFETERGSEIGEVVSRALAIQRLIKHGKLVRHIEIPVLFGFEKGQVETVVISTTQKVEYLLNLLKKEKNVEGNMWGLLLRDEGLWMNGNETLGSYNLYSLVGGGLILKPIVSPLMIRLCDNTIEMVEVDYSAKVIDVIEGICKSWNINPLGLCLKLGEEILDFVNTLAKQQISERDILDLCYELVPQKNDKDNEISTYLKYIQLKELMKQEEQAEHIREKDIINMGASQMIADEIDLQTFIKGHLPPKFRKEEDHFTEQIGTQHSKFLAKKMNTFQAQARYIKSFGYQTLSFPVTHNSEEKTLAINEKEIALIFIEKPTTILPTVTPVETTSRFFQALGFGTATPQPPPSPPKEEKKVTKWNMHLLRNFSREDKQIKILINMEEIVVSSPLCKELMNALEIYSTYVKEDILSRISNPRNSNQDHIYYERVAFSDEMVAELAASISEHPPTSLTLNWCTLSTAQAEAIADALRDAPALTAVQLNGFCEPLEEDSETLTPFVVLASALAKAKALTRVVAMGARLGDKALAALRGLAGNEQVRYLNLCFTSLPKQYLIDLQNLLCKREIILDLEVVPDESELVPWIGRHYKI